MHITMKLTEAEYQRLMMFRKLTPEQQRKFNEICRIINEMLPAETVDKPQKEENA